MAVARSQALHLRIRRHVAAARLSIDVLAVRTGWSYQRAVRILNGTTRPLAEDLEVLAKVLGKTPGDLYRAPARPPRRAR